MVNFWDVANVYADGCERTLLDPPLGPTVDDLATVWATLAWLHRDDTRRHHRGRVRRQTGRLHRPRLPDRGRSGHGRHNADCVNLKFALWDETARRRGPSFWAQAPEQQHRLWIIDVDGTRLVINEWSAPGTTPEQLADMDEFLASIQIG